jgi:hypothetical protein
LKFRPKDGPQEYLLFYFIFYFFNLFFDSSTWYDIPVDKEVEIKTGTCVVFANSLPHRFRKIRNKTNSRQHRTFINFFIVDPAYPIPLPFCYAYSDFIRLCLKRYEKFSISKYFLALFNYIFQGIQRCHPPRLELFLDGKHNELHSKSLVESRQRKEIQEESQRNNDI